MAQTALSQALLAADRSQRSQGPQYSPEVQERLLQAHEHALAAIARHTPNENVTRLVRTGMSASTATKRVRWIRQAASAWAEQIAPQAACRKGCSHCCHIAVAITDTEAQVLGQLIGVAPETPAGALDMVQREHEGNAAGVLPGSPSVDEGYASPCPFLAHGACSIYQHRPLVCRTQMNMDRDDLLCRLVPGQEIPVPYADATSLKGAFMLAQPAAKFADIRAFFPRGLE